VRKRPVIALVNKSESASDQAAGMARDRQVEIEIFIHDEDGTSSISISGEAANYFAREVLGEDTDLIALDKGGIEQCTKQPIQPVPVEHMNRVPDVARRLGTSDDWTRRYFGKVPGVKTIPSPARRGKRPYKILLIPDSVLKRELLKLSQ
jgi:hypothetical protein